MRSLASKGVTGLDEQELRVIVTLHAPLGSTLDEKAQLTRVHALQHRFAEKARGLGMSDLRGLQSFPIVFGSITPSRLLELAELPEVRAIEESEVRSAYRTQGAALMKANTLRTTHGANGSGIGVAVLDTGVDATHPELASRVIAEGNFTDAPGNGTIDLQGHGTKVAGVIAGTNGGIAPQAKIWAIKVLGDDGQGTDEYVLDGLQAVFSNRGLLGGVHVINMSLGGGGPFNSNCDALSPSYASVVNSIVNAGIIVFVASGNEGLINGVAFPACLSNTIAVGAVYDGNIGPLACDAVTSADKITCYSNSGNPLDILAPSHCARTPAPGGGYDNCFGGTSAASPYAAGVAAQILSLKPQLTPAQLLDGLLNTGRPRTDVNGITRNRVDAMELYEHLIGAGGGGGGGGGGPCVPGEFTVCAESGRFEITTTSARSLFPGLAGRVSPVLQGELGGAFHFFLDEENFHIVVKLSKRPSGFYAVSFFGGEPLEWNVRVRDTATGEVKNYSKAFGTLTLGVDVKAFPINP